MWCFGATSQLLWSSQVIFGSGGWEQYLDRLLAIERIAVAAIEPLATGADPDVRRARVAPDALATLGPGRRPGLLPWPTPDDRRPQ